MTEENLYQKIFASHFGHLAIIFLWTAGNLFHVAWQGNFEKWVSNPLKLKHLVKVIHIQSILHFQAYINGGTLLVLELIKNYTKVPLDYYYYLQRYYLLVGYIYNQNSDQVYL